ncbi:MAG: S8 family serine peptidase [Pseudomonadota bacterium]
MAKTRDTKGTGGLWRSFAGLALLGVAHALPSAAPAEAPVDPAGWLRLAVERLCPAPSLDGLSAQDALPASWLLSEEHLPPTGPPRIVRVRLALPGADEIAVERRQFQDRLRQFRVSYHRWEGAETEPHLQAIADGGCVIRSGRRIRREDAATHWLEQLDGDLTTLRWTEVLQAPWPPGTDPGGVRVGLIDSGLAYDLPLFRDRLARDAAGSPLGYDFWDLDPWPYDGDVARGPFLPIRHGTAVASILAREAPGAALVPYRFPRPDLSRMGAVIERAAAAGVRILAMPLGSYRREDWDSFAAALKAHDILAIVSAGNDGRDIDTAPIWPAALEIERMIVVTSADGFGRLAEGSNWGARSVDLMLPAENVPIVDFRGAGGTASGTSYAVPRLAAMAARILAAEPGLSATALKARIFARATPSPFEREGAVRIGWIPDPLDD